MKLISSAVLVVYIFSADSREVPDKPNKWSLTNTEETLELNGESLFHPDGPQDLDSSEILQEIMEEGETDNEIILRGNVIKNNLKTLMRKLNKIEKELAEGKSEQEIQLGSIDNNLIEIQSQNTKIEKLIDAIIGNGPISTEPPTTQHQTTTMQPTTPSGCSEELGFFKSGDQCFKLFPESRLTWEAANEFCIDHGLKLAKTDIPATAVAVRSFVLEKYGDIHYCWIGAHGTGSTFVWISDDSTLSSTNSAWWPGNPGSSTSSSYCVTLLVTQAHVNRYPSHPLTTTTCNSERLPLCELV